MKINYLVPSFPTLSETFIAREINHIRKVDHVDLKVFAFEGDEKSNRANYFPKSRYVQVLRAGKSFAKFPVQTLGDLLQGGRAYRTIFQAGYMTETLQREDCDLLVHQYIHLTADSALLVAKRMNVPLVFFAHARDIYLSERDDLARRMDFASAVVTCTEYNKNHLMEIAQEYSITSTKIKSVHHCIDPDMFEDCGIERDIKNSPKLLTVARLIPKKGIDTLLEAYKILKERSVDFQADIVGSNPLNINYEELSRDMGLSDHVNFTGSLPFEAVKRKYENADIFVLPSRIVEKGNRKGARDGLPNVLLESSLAGLPVISTDISGIPEGVLHGETGLLTESENPEALADVIQKLINNPERRRQMGQRGRQFVRENFNCEKNISKLLRTYANLVQ